ncbi:MAG TPA: Holliday junction resolvase RuvX [Chloroflexota bacterium]|nr:Holliday junction resolvase RuvX [Chloroflexota bacterium]
MTALGLDVGDRRIGVAVSDPTGLVARPLTVFVRTSNQAAAATIGQIADQNEADVIVVGVPFSGDEQIGLQAQKTLAFVRYLRAHLSRRVETWDERFTTVEAQREMIELGIRRSRRKELLDAAAAAIILDEWLAAHRPGVAPPPA